MNVKNTDTPNTEIISLKNLPIKLGQFLKICDCVQDGIEAKIRIQGGEVIVNDEIETRRGRQLKVGDKITFGDQEYIVAQKND